jgi:DNA-binding NtrC family response regulator
MIDQKYYMHNKYRSLDMKICIEKAESLAKNNKEILIYGEEGTEKDLLARVIHNHGENKGSPFVSVNCSFMPDSLFNLELFGKSKEEPGLLQLTEDGTIHLEEISDLSLFSQAKLVETLKNRSFRRIGECYDNKVNCRIITSSKKDLLQLVNENKFNFELFYLISVFPINIPPLRKRKEEILSLANSYIDEYNVSHLYNKKFLHPHTLKLLQSYDWPGNTIELHNVISRAIHYSSSQLRMHNVLVL